MLQYLIPIGIAAVVIGVIIAFLCSIYRVAEIDKALIVTGGKQPKIIVSGGSFVIPIFRKAQYFDLCMLTVTAFDRKTKKDAFYLYKAWWSKEPFVHITSKRYKERTEKTNEKIELEVLNLIK